MKKIYILTLLLCFTSLGSSFAQTLKGHIYDANTNEPLVGAAVTYKLQGMGLMKSSCPKGVSISYSVMWATKMY